MNLLLVDDEPLVLEVLDEAVAAALPQAARNCFKSASSALDYAKTARIDIAFLDINMRVMDGIALSKALCAIHPQVNIIFCTGYAEYALEAMQLYCSAYLTKPVTAEKVREAMRHLRFPVTAEPRVKFHCFGFFEAYCDGKPIDFQFNRTKELLAFLWTATVRAAARRKSSQTPLRAASAVPTTISCAAICSAPLRRWASAAVCMFPADASG